MNKNNLLIISLLTIVVVTGYFIIVKTQNKSFKQSESVMELKSSSFKNLEKIPFKYTCDGENTSPPLTITNIPSQTKSLAISLLDPDALVGTFTHWLMWNIPINTVEIVEGKPPKEAIEGANDFGNIGYGGPCPPNDTHRYVFKVTALDSLLKLPAKANIEDFTSAIKGHIITEAQLIGRFK